MLKCTSCSTDIPDQSLSCPSCGVAVDESITATRLLPGKQRSTVVKDRPATRPFAPQTPPSSISFDSIDNARFVAGTILADRYRIVGLLGKGGMGEVYRADDLRLGQPVALKFLPEFLSSDGAALARFHREVRIARQVSHRNVCRVYDIGEVDGQQFLSMEFIKGEELASLLRRIGRLPADKAVEIARQLCAGLAAAHESGVLHRDLKPGNVMIDGDGNVRVTDFGLAGLAEEFRGEGRIEGTPSYMSPEQLAGRELTVRSDLYSLGVVLYEVFTGRKAFEARTLPELLELRRSEMSLTSLSSLVKDVDPLVERVILRCLEKDPEKRPASALQVAAALPGGDPLAAALAAGETPSPEMVAAAPKQGVLRPGVALALLGSLLAGLALIVIFSGKVMLHRFVPLDKPPEVLRERAAEVVGKLGYSDPAADSTYGLQYDEGYLRYIKEHDATASRWEGARAGQPAVIYFWYRQSPRYLAPFNERMVTISDPPRNIAGMAGLSLDTRGRLFSFYAVPPQIEDPANPSTSPDWSALFAEAGLDPAKFKPVESKWIPPSYSDARAAWDGVYPDQPQLPVHVEAAAYRGKPVYFELIAPWARPARQGEAQMSTKERISEAIIIVLLMVVLVGAALLARQNLRLGRGDRKGAARLALFVLALNSMNWVIWAHHTPTLEGEHNLFFEFLANALMFASMLWLVYIALEPFVRRRWPGRIISWSRLLAGDVGDPLVGRDLLIGGLCGVALTLTQYAWSLVPRWLGLYSDCPGMIFLDTLLGFRGAVRMLMTTIEIYSLFVTLSMLFLLLLLSIALRREWLATAVLWIVFTVVYLLFGNNPATDWFFAAVTATITIFVLTRFGLLATMFLYLFFYLSCAFPLTSDFSSWYAGTTMAVLLLMVGLAVYGFYTSLAGQKLFRAGFLHD